MEFKYIELSGRENEVCNLLFTGLSKKEIADKLFISTNTVITHIQNILNKRCCNSRLELMAERIRELEDTISELRNCSLNKQ